MRSLKPVLLSLETRELLSAAPGVAFRPMFQVGPLVAGSSPPWGALTPSQVQTAYGFSRINFGTIRGDGTGQTIAIVDAYSDPNIQADLNAFDAQFGLANTTVTRVDQNGGTNFPATDPTGGWELEESLDVEWAHAIAPGARIVLVQATSDYNNDLLAAVDYAGAHAGVVSMSWGGSESSDETSSSSESHFIHPGTAFVASSGDNGAPISWPSSSPNVLSVGGTALALGPNGAWSSESGWSGSGGGPSSFEVRPAYQSGVVALTTMRANPDVAYDASPSTGFAVYDSVPYNGTSLGWLTVGGTSAGAPQWAALLAIADQGRALNGQSALNSASPQEVMTTLYKNAGTADFHDILGGSSAGSPSYSAGPGYDYVTGLGTPVANLVVASLDGVVVPPPSIDHLTLTAPTLDTAGTPFNLTVTARGANGATDAGYLGTVHFGSSDTQAGLPANYAFTAADAGSHTFTVVLKTAGGQSVSVTDTATSSVSGNLSGIAVSPAGASQFILTGLPASTTAGTPLSVTVTARDAYGNVATGYAGTVHFASLDPLAGLPAAHAFTTADKGTHAFTVTFQTAGTQSVTVADLAGLSVTRSGIAVSPAAPISLAAQAASTSQINLTWTGSAGATSYLIERSANGNSGWSQIGTATGAPRYQDTGLASGTTYYYRVRAAGGNVNSSYSNTASGTTSAGTVTGGGTDTLWSSSYVPTVNSYSAGSYELGVKIRTDVAGTVTGVRFYKQSWMNGYTHVGHLWSSTGALLATATFTNETRSGWEQVNFSNPVSIAANTVYVVSYSTGGGWFGITTNYFTGRGVDSGPLHALANGVSGGDGVYGVSSGTFPLYSGSGMNFWADVVFAPGTSPATPHAVAASTSAADPVASGNVVAVVPAGASGAIAAPSSSKGATVALGSWPYRRTVPQALTLGSSRSKGAIVFGS